MREHEQWSRLLRPASGSSRPSSSLALRGTPPMGSTVAVPSLLSGASGAGAGAAAGIVITGRAWTSKGGRDRWRWCWELGACRFPFSPF